MRIIHTVNLHLGSYFYTKASVLEHLKSFTLHQFNTLIVTSDICENRSPPSYARETPH